MKIMMSTRFRLLTFAGLLFATPGPDNSVQQWLMQSMLWIQDNGLTGQVLFVLALIVVSTTGLLPSSIKEIAECSYW